MIRKETLFHKDDKKWKPRNLQAALVIRRANPLLLHVAPHEPVFEKSESDRLKDELKYLRQKIENAEAANRERKLLRDYMRISSRKPDPPKFSKNMWAARAERKRRKYLGLPPLSTEEMRAHRKSMPGFGIEISPAPIRDLSTPLYRVNIKGGGWRFLLNNAEVGQAHAWGDKIEVSTHDLKASSIQPDLRRADMWLRSELESRGI